MPAKIPSESIAELDWTIERGVLRSTAMASLLEEV
jgi:hypothetical protein